MASIKKQIDSDKYKTHTISAAQKEFGEWFKGWTAYNKFETSFKYERNNRALDVKEDTSSEDKENKASVELSMSKVAEKVVEDMPEAKMQSIGVAMGEKETKEEVEIKEVPLKIEVREVEKEVEAKVEKVVEDITSNIEKPVSDVAVKVEEEVEEVVPDTLFDETAKKHQEAEDAIAKAKKALREKEKQNVSQRGVLPKVEKQIEEKVSNEMNAVLEAPVAEGQKLSPEELKRQYREALSKAAKSKEQHIDIEVKVIEN
jgi:hypothetical protein